MHERDIVSGMSVFVAVVRAGSFTSAAKATGLTPSAVSKTIARLETGFGTQLVSRSTRRMTVTDAGQAFFERSASVLEELRAIEQEMASTSAEPRGRVRLSAPLLFGQALVAPAVFSFMKKAPAVSVDLDLSDRFVDLVEERVDIAVRITSQPPASFVARRAGYIRRSLCASPAYLRGAPKLRKPQDLSQHACLVAPYQSSSVWEFPGGAGAAPESVRIEARLRLNSTMALHDAARAGLGIADLPRYLVEEDLRSRRLVAVLQPLETRASSVFVIYGSGSFLPARTRELAKHV
ncbi:MAG TPA: LysR family transcriptional regulator, partial [Polyangiaceae bacterium]|nr:LysR family transcriptional regulator [Polyangiaceae bacterium]